MEVNGPGPVQGAYPVNPARPQADVGQSGESKPISTDDKVEISAAGMMMDKLSQSGELRAERLAQIKADIEAGVYETPEKLEAALSRMISDLDLDE